MDSAKFQIYQANFLKEPQWMIFLGVLFGESLYLFFVLEPIGIDNSTQYSCYA